MITEEYRGARQWSRSRQAAFSVAWISFLAAAVGSVVLFALFDPLELAYIVDETLEIERNTGYAAGFFFLWILTLLSSAVTAFMVRTAPKRDAKHRKSP